MNLCAKTEYACLAILELASRYGSGETTRVRDIAEKHGIPSPFLVQILLQLKGAGLVESTRGALGGYRLIKNPEEISLGDVKSAIEGMNAEISSNATLPTAASRVLLDAWTEIDAVQREMLANISVSNLVEKMQDRADAMYYI